MIRVASFTSSLSRGAGCVRIAGALFTLLVALQFPGAAWGQVVRTDLWTTDGQVRAAVLSGSTLYVGGVFTYVGPRTGGGGAVDTSSGGLTGFPNVAGTVNVAIPDGAGGWYVGGTFLSIGGVARTHLAHILSSNIVDPGFVPNPSAQVTALALHGSTLYVAGGFVVIGGQSRLRAAAVDASTGAALAWNPAPNNTVFTMVVRGSTLYVGGQFSIIGGQARGQMAAFDAASGGLLAWNPAANGPVRAIVPLGPAVYVGGGFSTIGGQPRNWLAALDTLSATALPWNPNPVTGVGIGIASMVAQGSTLYTAGSFTTISGQSRGGLAAIDTSGTLGSWNPNPNQLVNALAASGPTIFAGGAFTSIGGQTRFRVAALDAVTGNASPWTAHSNDRVDCLAVSGTKLFVGGICTSVGGVPRTNVAALDLISGAATTWNPGANNTVRALAVSASALYVGGDFTQTDGQTRGRLAAFSLSTGNLLSWNPNSTSGSVNSLSVSGSVVYAGGFITTIGGQARSGLAGIDAATGLVTAWNPNATGGVVTVVIASGPTIYVGGGFTQVGGAARNFIAALDTVSGVALAGFNPSANNQVNTLALRDSTLYVGGFFTLIGGQTRNRIAAIHATSGSVTGWNPNATSSSVSAITVEDAVVYAGGGFTNIGGELRNNLAALDAATGLATPWNPDPNSSTFALTTGTDVIFAGGQFTTLGTQPGSVAAIDAACSPPMDVADSSATLAGPVATVIADFDGDGKPDLAAAVSSGVQVLRNQAGHFNALSSAGLGGPGRGIATADFNYDFAPDLAVSAADAIHVLLGQKANGVPTGTFNPPTSYPLLNDPRGVAVGDFNEDGITDLAVAVSGANSVKVLLGGGSVGIGNGSFAAPLTFAVASGPRAIAVGDFNVDGISDLAVSDSTGNAVSILLGQGSGGAGNGSFAAAVNYAVTAGPVPIVVGDFNQDGAPDLAAGTTTSVAVLLGNVSANGTFSAATYYAAGGTVRDLFAADFDANGRVDLGATLGTGGAFQYLYGDGVSVVGNGRFLLGPAVTIGGNLSALEFGAFDPAVAGGSCVVARYDLGDLVSVRNPCAPATPPLLEMTSPNGGEALQLATNVPIQWARNALVPAVHIEISRDGGAHWKRIASGVTGTEYRWTSVAPGSLGGRMRVVDAQRQNVADMSNGTFQMQPLVAVGDREVRRPSFSLPYPNPTRDAVRFDLSLPAAGVISIEVFDVAGRRVQTLAKGRYEPGEHRIIWDGHARGGRAADGVYFVRARLPGFEAVRRVVRIE